MDPESFRQKLSAAIGLQQKGQPAEAAARFKAILAEVPGHAYTSFLCGLSLQEAGDPAGAVEMLSRAILVTPGEPDFHRGLGIVLRRQGRLGPAVERLLEARRLAPNHAETHFHLGDARMDQGRLTEAMADNRAALAINSGFREAWVNLGLCHKALGELDEALACFDKAIAGDPDYLDGRINRALTLLMMGRWTEAWPEYEWRLRMQTGQRNRERIPPGPQPWRGEPLAGKRLLILSEQGFGDNIQFVRYLPVLQERGAETVLETPLVLRPLFEKAAGVDRLIDLTSIAEQAADCDYHCTLLSLPGLLGATPETIPAPVPYLFPDPDHVERLAPRFAGADRKGGLKVGLFWNGKPLHQNDPARRRSCPLAKLAPLASLAQSAGISFFSLQTDPDKEPLLFPPDGLQPVDLGHAFVGFGETSGALAHLDLLISVDTAVAHLAGAMGKPVWMLTPLAPDWRWGLERADCPWYPTLRLFRQKAPGDWSAPIAEIAARLERAAAGEPVL